MTKTFDSYEELLSAIKNNDIDPDDTVTIVLDNKQKRVVKARLGLVLLALPSDLKSWDYKSPLNKKQVKKIIAEIILSDHYTKHEKKLYVDRLKEIGYLMVTLYGISLTDKELDNDDPELKKIKRELEKLAKEGKLDEYTKLLKKAEKILAQKEKRSKSELYDYVESGSSRGWSEIRTMKVARGPIVDTTSQFAGIINGDYINGYNEKEFFQYGKPARKGIIDRSIATADPGYLTRQLLYSIVSVELDPDNKDCGTNEFLEIILTEDIAERLFGRYIVLPRKGLTVVTDTSMLKDYIGQKVKIRSPVYCQSEKICRTCYGKLYDVHKSVYIGSIAAQSIGERLSQEIMKTFHKGAAAAINYPTVEEFWAKALRLLRWKGIDASKLKNIVDSFFETSKDNKYQAICKAPELYVLVDLNLFSKDEINSDTVIDGTLELEIPAIFWFDVTSLFEDYLVYNGLLYIQEKEQTAQEHIEHATQIYISDVMVKIASDKFERKGNIVELAFNQGDIVFEIKPYHATLSKTISEVMRTFRGTLPRLTGDPSVLLHELYTKLENVYSGDLIHIEIVLSQMLRCPTDESIPYRLCPNKTQKPVVRGIHNIPRLESWLRGMTLERADTVILDAIGKKATKKSMLEELLLQQV